MSLSTVLFRAMGICAFWATGLLNAQHLTISTSGQTGTSGTNWSITGNTLNVTASNVSAHIHPSVITNHLTGIGDLTIVLPWVSGIPRDLNINSSIVYTGSTARTLTFNIVNDIIAASGISISSSNTSLNLVLRTAMSSSNTDHGRIQLDGTTISTNGGHFWAGGGSGSSTWNSLTVGNTYSRTWADDVSGVSFLNASLTTSGGNIYMAGMSYNTSDADGENYGINIRNSSITSGAGQIDILGDLKGMYTTGSGLGIFGNSGTVTISSTTGAINLTGTGADQAGTNTGWRRGALLYTLASTGVSVTSTSGNITITGTAAFPTNGNDDMMGLQLGTTQSIADGIKITSQTGNIRLAGSNTRENAGQNSNAVQFIAANTSNSIRIGYNGTNAYSGNITIEGNSIIQNNVNAGSGSISVKSTGTLTIQPSGNAFTYLRAGAGTLTFDDDWAFGTTLSGFTFGKSTNTLALTYSNALSVAGPITMNANNITLNGAFSTTASSGLISLIATGEIIQSAAITTQGGSLIAWADKDGTSGGRIHFNANITTNGGHIYAGGGTASETASGLTVPAGYASSAVELYSGITINGNTINSGGGIIRMKGNVSPINGTNAGLIVYNATISSGAGALSLFGQRTGDPFVSAGLFIGTNIGSSTSTGNVTITSTTGDIYLEGTQASITNTHSWSHGLAIVEYGGDDVTISSTTGNITLFGDATNSAAYGGEAVGFVIQSDNVAGLTRINTDGGTISITGKSGNTGDDYGSSYRGANIAGNITIGDANTGNITLLFGSLSGNTNTGSVSLLSAGSYVIEGISGGAFAAAIDINVSFSFGSAGTGLRVGSATNNQDISMRPNTTVAGPITIYANQFSFYNNLISSTASDIGVYANTHVWTNNSRQTIQTAGGNIYLYADADANGSGQLEIDYLTFNPGAGNTTIRGETVNWATGSVAGPFINGTGGFTFESSDASFGQNMHTSWFEIDQDGNGISALTFGKSGSTQNVYPDAAFTVAGPITIYAGTISVSANLTSSANGDILFKGIVTNNPSIQITSGVTVNKSSGTGTLTMQAHSRIINYGNITATGSGVINVVLWSDFDNSNNDGGVSQFGTISTNGGHVWMGGSNSSGGSYTWNSLTVGDGPSIGSTGYNCNAMDLFGPVTTGGGDVLIWAGSSSPGCGTSGIVSDVARHINTGSGNITLIALQTAGTIQLTSTGTITLVPNGGSYASALTIGGTSSSGIFTFNTSHYSGVVINSIANVGGLTIGRYAGVLSSGTPVVMGNTSNVTMSAATSITGPLEIYGGAIALNANLTTTGTSTGNITISGTTISGTGNLAVASGRTASITVTSASTYEGIISGTGSGLTKLGAGALTLTKDHTYTGNTTISAGDLQVGTGGSVSQASSGSLATASAVSVASGCKLILAPNENMTFANNVSGAGGLEIKGMSGAYYNSFLTGTATTMVSNSSVLEVLTRITGGLQDGAAVAAGATRTAGAYVKSYNAATNTATLQFQQFDGIYTKCVFAQLSQSGTNVQIAANTSVYSGAAYRTGNSLGSDMSTGSTAVGALATSSGANGYGISNVYMSGKVNFTGALTYSGATTLSNTVTNVTSPNTYSYTSRGTQEITNASTSFPSGSSIVNNGLVIFNRTTALTVSNDMSGTEEVLQVGADITMTGTNTYTGNTTIDLNKTLNIGSGSTSGSMTGNIINYGTLSFNRSDSSSYTGVISGTGAVTKNGSSATTVNAGRLILQRDVPATSSSGYSGAGILVVQPDANSFTNAVTYPIAGFTVSSSIGGLTIGKPTNTASITVNGATQAAGPITLYGGSINVSSALTAAGNILLDADAGSFLTQNTKGITISAAITTTNNGNITLLARGGSGSGYSETHGVQCTQTVEAGGTGTISITAYGGLSSNGIASSCHGINLDGSSAWIKSNGGNVTLSGYGGGAGTGSYSQGFAMANSAKVSAAGSGTINITGTGGVNTVIGLRGIVLVSSSSIYTAGGTITLTGNNGTNGSDNSDGITIDNATVGSNTSGAITLTGYAGGGTGSEAISISSSSTIGGTTHAGNILMQGNAFSIASAASILTTGQLTIEPTSGSFSAALTYPISNLTVASTITGLTLGKSGNTANITLSAAQSVAGPIAVYGGTLTFNDNVSSTAGGNINLYGNTLSFTSGKTVSSTGQLLVAPAAVSTTVGLAGATGTLQVTSTHLSTNFANGFSNITIGSDAQTGNIASNAFTLQDNMTFKTSGTLSLAGNITLGTNNATLGNALSMGTGTNYFMTNSTGVLKRSVGNAGTFAFPVGNSAYNPVSITNNTGAADEFNLRVLDEVYRDGTSGSVLTSPRVKRTWLIGKTNANAGSGINFVFNWNTGESTSGLNSPRLYHYNGTEWEKQTGTTSSSSSSLTYTGYTGTFSPFAIGDDIVLLPVSWLSFDCGKKTSQGTELNWSTASEQNSSRFIIERSQNGQTFEPIGIIPAAGYSHSIRQYRFTDPNPFKTRGYYRIAMEENNGHRVYTSICMSNVNADAENNPVQVYPNPSKGTVNIYAAEDGSYQISDMAGRLIRAGKLDGITQIEGLKSGVYTLTIQSGDDRYTQKLLVE